MFDFLFLLFLSPSSFDGVFHVFARLVVPYFVYFLADTLRDFCFFTFS